MMVQPPDEEAEAEAEGGRPARTVFRVCAVPHGIVRCISRCIGNCDRGCKGLFRRCVWQV